MNLEQHFDNILTGPGVHRWRHYLPAYERHLAKFQNTNVHILEIGVFSGGGLRMWQSYFGPDAHIYGVDINPVSTMYANEQTTIFIGDQSDPAFWDDVKQQIPVLDVVIDDGSHEPAHQITTLEALLWHLQSGGVYAVEDSHGSGNAFNDYIDQMQRRLHDWIRQPPRVVSPEEVYEQNELFRASLREPHEKILSGLTSTATDFQRTVDSIHLYPYLAIIERNQQPIDQLTVLMHGTEWQPF